LKTCHQIAENPEKECGSEKEGLEIIKNVNLSFIYIESYFDINEFEKAPIKNVIRYEYKPTNSLLKVGNSYFVKKNKVVVNNS